MVNSRRNFLKAAAATGTLAAVPAMPAAAKHGHVAPERIVARFAQLPGDTAFKIFAPAAKDKKAFVAQLNSDRILFVASAIKTFVLCEALRQADSLDVDQILEQRELALDSTVWSFGSPTFTPPDITGVVTERTAMEAMITRSDNTATDMMFKAAGADNVRNFIASAGLTSTLVPDSTRAFAGYLFGAPDYENLTWEQLQQVVTGPIIQPFLNDVQTLASSANDFVSYYSRALQGEFFQHRETLNEFRRLLTLSDFIYLVPLPLGVSAYAKSGNADTPGFHARSIAGGLFFGDQWIYFAFIINWYAESGDDPETIARFFSAINESLTLVKSSLSKD
ncbi:MAG: serine hydrolase [Gammaproteobacteria bacterium]